MKKIQMAYVAHKIWSKWMKHFIPLFEGGGVTKDDFIRWKRLMNTPFHKLTEKEQESDYKVGEEVFAGIGFSGEPPCVEDDDLRIYVAEQIPGMWRYYRHGVFIQHKPSGRMVFCDEHKSQHKNRAAALDKLLSELAGEPDGNAKDQLS